MIYPTPINSELIPSPLLLDHPIPATLISRGFFQLTYPFPPQGLCTGFSPSLKYFLEYPHVLILQLFLVCYPIRVAFSYLKNNTPRPRQPGIYLSSLIYFIFHYSTSHHHACYLFIFYSTKYWASLGSTFICSIPLLHS